MKKSFLYLLAVTAFTATFTSCSNDNDEPIVPGVSLEEKAYASQNLDLSLNGSNLVGKKVTFTPDGNGNANITLTGEPLNLSDLIGGMTKADSATEGLSIPTAGVLPGSPSVVIPVKLEGEADSCTFKGTGETDFCTYSYSGYATPENFKFDLSDVKLKNTSLAGTWTVPEFEGEDFFQLGRVEWKAEKDTVIIEVAPGFGWPFPLENIIRMATVAYPFFDPDTTGNPTKNIMAKLNDSLKDVTFGENGNVTATYKDAKTGELSQAPAGVAQYVIEKEGTIRLFLNPAAIIANTVANAQKISSRALDPSMLLPIAENLMQNLLPMLTQGIPVNYGPAIIDLEGNTSDASTAFYLGTETLLPLLKGVAPLFSNEEFVKALIEEAGKDPSMGSMAPMLGGILKALPQIIETTSKVEIGINMIKN